MMKDKVMSEKAAKVLVVVSAIFLLLVGFGLYKLFEYQFFFDALVSDFVALCCCF